MVGRRLNEIPRSVCVRFWHHTSLNLFKYLYYEKLWVSKYGKFIFKPIICNLIVHILYIEILYVCINVNLLNINRINYFQSNSRFVFLISLHSSLNINMLLYILDNMAIIRNVFHCLIIIFNNNLSGILYNYIT